jgi:probable rRNA maturation factor
MSTNRYDIEIENDIEADDVPMVRLIEAAEYVLQRHHVAQDTALTIVITDDMTVRHMNNDFRGVDAVTDILSFPADPLPDEIDEAPYLGDLIIAYPYTTRQAVQTGHTLTDELVLLVVHGTLHLLGFDHDNATHQDVMWAEQTAALEALAVHIDVPRFDFDE